MDSAACTATIELAGYVGTEVANGRAEKNGRIDDSADRPLRTAATPHQLLVAVWAFEPQ